MLRRLRRKASSLFRRSLGGKDVPSLYGDDQAPSFSEDWSIFRDSTGPNMDALAAGMNACTEASYRGIGINSRRTDHVQEQSHGETTRVTPSPYTSRTVTERQIRAPATEPSRAMSSSTVAPCYYRPVSASILDGLDEETQQDAGNPVVPNDPRATLPPIQPKLRGQGQTRPAFQYRATNPAILDDFGDIFAPAPQASRRAASDGQIQEPSSTGNASRGYRPPSQALFSGFDEAEQPRPEEKVGVSHGHTSPLQPASGSAPVLSPPAAVQSNNPYAKLIEHRQNAMTTNFLRSQHDLGGGELPAFPADEQG